MRVIKKEQVLDILQKNPDGVGYHGLKEMVDSDDRGIMRSIACLRSDRHNIQITDVDGKKFVKLSSDPMGQNPRRKGVSQSVLETIQKGPISVSGLCEALDLKDTRVFSTIHALRQHHVIETKDGVYTYVGKKGGRPVVQKRQTETVEMMEPSTKTTTPSLSNDIVFGRITQKDMQRVPESMLKDFIDTLRKTVFYYDMVKTFINASQTVDKFMNSAE